MDKPEKNPYREHMEQVNLTPEARERILTNVQQADLSPQPEQKIVPFRPQKKTWRRWASLAACLVVVVAAVLAVPQLGPSRTRQHHPSSPARPSIRWTLWRLCRMPSASR